MFAATIAALREFELTGLRHSITNARFPVYYLHCIVTLRHTIKYAADAIDMSTGAHMGREQTVIVRDCDGIRHGIE
jgi:aspartokinase-like uncharacterized kinase